MDGKGVINIDILEEKNKVYVDISDTGKGIPAKMQKRIFSPGYTSKSRGWGLGLTLQQVGGNEKYIEEYFHKSMAEIKKDLREMMYDQALIEQEQSKITGSITITPSEVKQFASRLSPDSMPVVPTSYQFGEVVKIPPVSETEIQDVKDRLTSYRERVLRGEKFSMLARLYSDDPGSASKGGDLGFVERGTRSI